MMDCDASSYRGSSSGSSSCQLLTRKKRRGIIEKRRRDRINSSLSELRRLVPTAFEKQGSAKLEKAEILQMTVDHLKMLSSKGVDAFTFDPHKFAMDYHSMGFRECASEVARYLVAIEGIDLQDPLRLRLMSHLQCYSAQRELAAKSSWSPGNGASPAPHYPASLPSPQPAPAAAGEAYGTEPPRLPIDTNGFRQHFPARAPHVPLTPPSATASAMLPAPPHAQAPANQYFHGVAGFSPMTSTSSTTLSYGSDLSQHSGSGVKPYRPWGSEIAY